MAQDHDLKGKRILVVEDAFLLALDIANAFEDLGAEVLGPTGDLEATLNLLSVTDRLDGAVLDLNLQGDCAYPIADLLMQRGVPFVFATAYDTQRIADRFAGVTHFQKPVDVRDLAGALAGA